MLPRRSLSVWLVSLLLLAGPLAAQDVTPYQVPSPVLAAFVDAPATPSTVLSPDRSRVLVLERADRLSMAEMAAPERRLAGLRFDPRTAARSRTVPFNGVAFVSTLDGSTVRAHGLPEPTVIIDTAWSRDGQHVAVVALVDGRLEPWVVVTANGAARRLADVALTAVLGDALAWVDHDTLVATVRPVARGPEPEPPTLPTGPTVLEHAGGRAAARTYADTLNNAHGADLFTYHGTSELALLTLGGAVTPLPYTGLISSCLPSPDGQYLLVRSYQRPFSYHLPASRFPLRTEVLDRTGAVVRRIADLPLAESVGLAFGSVRAGPREITWRQDADAQLSWFEALDDGDAEREAGLRDAWLTWAAPFAGSPTVQQRLAFRASRVIWGDDARALLTETWRRTRLTRTWLVDPSAPLAPPVVVEERSTEDRYADPGDPVMMRNAQGRLVLHFGADGESLYRSGDGASAEGDQPFLDRVNLRTGESERLWQSTAPRYEEFVAFLEGGTDAMLIRREGPTEPPQLWRWERTTGAAQVLTSFPHPHPEFDAVKVELIRYAREDGVALTGRLYLPPGYEPARDGPRPALLWAYPRDYLSADAAGQVRTSPWRFPRITPTSPLPLVLAGYVVLDDPALPIVAEGRARPNDTYVPQLVAGAKAAVDELVRRGVADPQRIAVGGHSYGAFMAANLLAHSDLFRAGIARSGAYNRTLTPFGFQAETRHYWRAPEVYATMSPFHHANRIKTPLLLIHGEADENSGTFPIQSERLYQALKGLGAEVRYVTLPHEGHSYRGRESLLHLLWETEQWLHRHLN